MQKALIAILSLAAAVAVAAPAAAKIPSPGNPCPAPDSTFTVNPGNAALVSDGFTCKNVHLVISASITPTTSNLSLEGRTIQVTAGVDISNNLDSGSEVVLRTYGGGIGIEGATIRANVQVLLQCIPALCTIAINNSTIRSPINDLLTTGITRALASGDVTITNSTFFGKSKVIVVSTGGKVTWICPDGGNGDCKDPVTSGVLAQLTDQTTGQSCAARFAANQPCLVDFANAQTVHDVCFPPNGGDDFCGGGSSECQVTARGDVDLHGSNITCNSHFHVKSTIGNIDLRDANITATTLLSFRAARVIDATNAQLTSQTSSVILNSQGQAGPNVPCIIITGATISNPNSIEANGCPVTN